MEGDTMPLTNAAGASTVAFLPAEIWLEIAEQINDRKTLQSFALTCRRLSAISQPRLFAERKMFLHLLRRHAESLPPRQTGTKDLKVVIYEFERCEDPNALNEGELNEYSSFLARILSQLENLQSFQWLDQSWVFNYDSALILNNHTVVERLGNLASLRHISIQFAGGGHLFDQEDALKCWIPLDGFTNLLSLELYQFYAEDINSSTMQLARALRNSPNLEKLGLGVACDADTDSLPAAYVLEDGGTFFERLCLAYGCLSDSTGPLHLKTLTLGTGVCLSKSRSNPPRNYLAQLTQVDRLVSLELYNGLVKFGDDDGDSQSSDDGSELLEIDCSLLKDCKSLHHVSVSRISPDIIRWLSGPASTVQELLVIDPYSIYNEKMKLFDELKLDKLSMLYISDEDWPFRYEDEEDAAAHLAHLADADVTVITILDRISKRNALSNLKKLSFTLHFETQWIHLNETLPLLSSLQQLHIRGCNTDKRLAKNLWPLPFPSPKIPLYGQQNSGDNALEYARAIYELCPSLRYIAIGDRPAWHIQYCEPVEENDTGLRFIPVVEEDLERIEMFTWGSHSQRVLQSGLLVSEYDEESKARSGKGDPVFYTMNAETGQHEVVEDSD